MPKQMNSFALAPDSACTSPHDSFEILLANDRSEPKPVIRLCWVAILVCVSNGASALSAFDRIDSGLGIGLAAYEGIWVA